MKKIYLFPYAGGSSMMFSKWHGAGAEYKAIEYSGHGFRIKEPTAKNISEMIDDIIGQIDLSNDYALLGHSMGALLAYETVLRLSRCGDRLPFVVGLSACEPPEVLFKRKERFESLSSDPDRVIQFMLKYERMSKKRLMSDFFRDKFLPYIQNDYRILAEYEPGERVVSDIPAMIFYSKTDSLMDYGSMRGWEKYFLGISFCEMSGEHFYIEEDTNIKKIINLMTR